ncbi:MAG: response regulator [Betaproteobacteria bacterium]|nr:response regulator [Betaproteobacteria bacterium]
MITAEGGQEALDKLAEGDFDVVYTDLRMPGMDGLEVAARVKQRKPRVPVVIVTGYGSAANEACAKVLGVSAFLNKPLSPEMIEQSAREEMCDTQAAAAGADATVTMSEPAPEGTESRLTKIALFFAAPFIGLAYVIAFPFIGLSMIAWYGGRALFKRTRAD